VRCVLIDGPGRPEDLVVREVGDPVPGPGEILLDVDATAVNRADLLQRRGRYPPPPGESEILGLEAAGTIGALGPGVQGWAVGDRAMALLAGGGYAERVVVPSGQLMAIPPRMSTLEAAAIPEAFLTAWLSLRHLIDLRPGEVLLVHAVASGVGLAAVQIARELGARVLGTTRSAAKAQIVTSLGAEVIVAPEGLIADRVRELTDGRGVDGVLDLVGAALWPQTLDCLAEGSRMSIVGLVGGSRIDLDLARMMQLQARLAVTSLRGRSREQKADLVDDFEAWAAPRLAEGRLLPVIHATLPLGEAPAAHRLLEENATTGKVVLITGR
jgi:putative PIG3 family NAD(P)H quinone oxidoreductase